MSSKKSPALEVAPLRGGREVNLDVRQGATPHDLNNLIYSKLDAGRKRAVQTLVAGEGEECSPPEVGGGVLFSSGHVKEMTKALPQSACRTTGVPRS